jgi:hypothetical protein
MHTTQPGADNGLNLADNFRGDNDQLCSCIEALLELDAANALVPHGVGGHARGLLASAAARLRAPQPVEAESVVLVGYQMIARPSVFYPASHRPNDIKNFRAVYTLATQPSEPAMGCVFSPAQQHADELLELVSAAVDRPHDWEVDGPRAEALLKKIEAAKPVGRALVAMPTLPPIPDAHRADAYEPDVIVFDIERVHEYATNYAKLAVAAAGPLVANAEPDDPTSIRGPLTSRQRSDALAMISNFRHLGYGGDEYVIRAIAVMGYVNGVADMKEPAPTVSATAGLNTLQRYFNSEFGVEPFSRVQHKNMPNVPTYFLAADVEKLLDTNQPIATGE